MSDDTALISKAMVAAMLSVTPRQIERYAADPANPLPIAVRAAKGSRTGHRYDIRAVHQWAIGRMIDDDSGEALDLTTERAKLARAQRVRQEFLHQVDLGRFASIEDMAHSWGTFITNCRARLLALPSKTAPLLAVEDRAAVCAASWMLTTACCTFGLPSSAVI